MPYRYSRNKEYPNVHNMMHKFLLTADGGTSGRLATIIPCIMQDEGLGAPSSKNTHPENASFSVDTSPNCYPDSKVNFARCDIDLSLTKGAWNTDNTEVLKAFVFPIYTAFLENLTAKDEVTANEVEDILELQHETTDRQTYPLWNGTDLTADGTKGDLASSVPGLTTDQSIEGVDLNLNTIYNALQYYTNGGVVRKSIGKIRGINISRKRNVRMSFRLKSKSKRMNPYTFWGIAIILPNETAYEQQVHNGDLTAIDHLIVRSTCRYNEWNENFDHTR
jgi:hypothetical protein